MQKSVMKDVYVSEDIKIVFLLYFILFVNAINELINL